MDKTQPPPQPLKNTTLPLGDLQTKAITQHIETMLTETIRKDKAEGRVSWAAEHPEEYRANQYNSLVTKENADGIRQITEGYIRQQNGVALDSVERVAIRKHIETLLNDTIKKDKAEGRVSWAAEHPEEYRANQYNSLVTKENADGIRNITQSHVSDLMHNQTDNKTDLNIEYFIQNMSKALPRTPSPRGK